MKKNIKFKSIKIIDSGKAIKCILKDGSTIRYHADWLRDNALDSQTRDTNNGQRLINPSDFVNNTHIQSVSLNNLGKNIALVFAPDQKKINFSSSWLLENTYDKKRNDTSGLLNANLKLWNKNFLKKIPLIDYQTAKSNKKKFLNWLLLLNTHGFAKMKGGKIESGALVEVANLFGYIRETNYGKFFNVRSKINAINLAYTNLGLSPHTDNPYRDPVPTMQILYCLENSVKGGDSIVIDGFYAARLLKKQNAQFFNLLTKYPANFEFKEKNRVHLKSNRPLIELSSSKEIVKISFNNRSMAPITDVPYKEMNDYYKAYVLFSKIINNPEMAVKFKLNPGECFVVDNTRVLHARTAYSGKGSRWLQGCYVDKDGLLSTISTIKK